MIPLIHRPPPEIEVRCDRDGRPLGFLWRRRWRAVGTVERTWSWVHGWWGDDAQNRAYVRLIARDGLRCTIFRDNETGRWHMYETVD